VCAVVTARNQFAAKQIFIPLSSIRVAQGGKGPSETTANELLELVNLSVIFTEATLLS